MKFGFVVSFEFITIIIVHYDRKTKYFLYIFSDYAIIARTRESETYFAFRNKNRRDPERASGLFKQSIGRIRNVL
jgi:hypothetical protein